jgi:tetratricopeptide (TPR) repeat protein
MNKKVKKGHKHQKGVKKSKFTENKKLLPYFLGGILLLTLILFGSSVNHQFVDLDDPQYVTENYTIRQLNAESVGNIFSSFQNANYHPLTTTLNAIHYHFFKLNPMPYHATNLLLHLLNILLVFYLIYLMTKETATSVITALFFAIHPFHVESVSWVSELKDVLYTFFYLASLICYYLFLSRDSRMKYYIYALVLFLLSCFSKSAAITLPVLLLLFDYFKGRKFSRDVLLEKIPFFAISVVFGLLAIFSQQSEGAIREIEMHHGFFEKIFYITYSISYYILGVFFPFNLAAIHPYPKYLNGMLPMEYYLSPLLVLLVIWWVYKNRKNKDLVFGSVFFIVTLSLVIQIIPLGQAIVAERYTYVPYIGAFFIVGRYYSKILKRSNRIYNYLFFILIAFAVYFSVTTFKRNMVWRDSLSLFTDASSKNPGENNLIYNNLGTSKFNSGDYEGAIEAFNKAIELGVHDEAALNNRGSAKFILGRIEEALADFNAAIKAKPDFSDPYRNRGVIWYQQQNFNAAIADFDKCLELNPEDGIAYYYRGIAKSKINDMNGACEDWGQASKRGVEKAVERFNEHCK